MKKYIEKVMKEIERRHLWDNDPVGNELFIEYQELYEQMDKNERTILQEIMKDSLKKDIDEIYLRFLSCKKNPDSAKFLRGLLEEKKENEEYAYYISYYLLRFGRNEDITLIKSLVTKYLIRKKISQWLQVVFELLKSDYKFSIDMIVKYIMIDCETFTKFSSSLMSRIVKLDEKIFEELMKCIRKKDGYKYKVISENIIEELKKPWSLEKYDKVKIKHLLEVLK